VKRVLGILLVLLPPLGALAGYSAAPLLARADYTVRVASRLMWEEAHPDAEPTDETEAFRDTGGGKAALYERAAAIAGKFTLGGALFGAWLGLVIALKMFTMMRVRNQETYEIDHGVCVSCGRCFLYCPRERLRLKKAKSRTDETITGGKNE